MTYPRLTNMTREHIATQAVKNAFEPREAQLAKDEDALAREAYAAVFTADEIKKAVALPKNWLRRDSCLNFNVAGLRIELCTLENHMPVPYRSKNGDSGYGCHRDQGSIMAGELADRITAHAVAKDALRQERRDTYRKLNSMLSSITTIKKLEEAWPEGKPFYEINAALGLTA
ncbi:Nmad5 family putative nucleotide modification protein [Paracoccus hibiscisoli]|uniref:Nmad5 family putative nucleotide modification protein n=1 Tax=Paracoccus hibiscisoli TaxID=2023261 RepID=UPI0023F2959D|nr:Nmad5 family putative nucleotide modification protein [Paracoccus hibiscisoli]